MLTNGSRRDGSSFMNLLMIAPLCDSRGRIRYYIGAQVDVTGLVKDCTDMESLQQLVAKEQTQQQQAVKHDSKKTRDHRDEFQQLSEMFNMGELDTVRKWGGRMHREYQDDELEDPRSTATHMRRVLLKEPAIDTKQSFELGLRNSGRLSGIYQNVSGLETW